MLRFFATILLLILTISFELQATHIVGGEFELVHIRGYEYRLRLNQYFDHIHGNPGAEDFFLDAHIFRKRDNRYMEAVELRNLNSTFVPYTNPECSNSKVQLQTRSITYSKNIYLSPDVYNDPEGYYIIWERCCRNNVITNIRDAESTGQAFYLEFPPVVKNEVPFVNSSPILFPPLSDYAVVNQLYYVNFGGQDPDGDSLVYSLVVPLRGNSSPDDPIPAPRAAPYSFVSWDFGYNLANVIPGKLPLSIDTHGMIRVIPDHTGLFVFSVKCEEYRNNIKIGEVIRDFQLLVVDIEVGNKPKIRVQKADETFYNEGEIIRFAQSDIKCFKVLVTDPDNNQKIKVKAVPVNFTGNLDGLFSSREGIITDENDTLKFDVCIPDCPLKNDGPFIIDFIAMDNACSLPLMDTVRMSFIVEPPQNESPFFINPVQSKIYREIEPGEKLEIPLSGVDSDGDKMIMSVHPQGFQMENFEMDLIEVNSVKGAIDGIFTFNSDCSANNYSLKSEFTLFVTIKDITSCNNSKSSLVQIDIKVKFPEDVAPEISTDLPQLQIERLPGELIEFNVMGNDKDNDLITLVGFGEDFAFSAYGMQFENKSGTGNVSSLFSWDTQCSSLQNRDEFNLKFVVDDRGSCKASHYDTLTVQIKIKTLPNEAPVVSVDDIAVPEITVVRGKQMQVRIIGFDSDRDSIYLRMQDQPHYRGLQYEFKPVRGVGRVSSDFIWTPECIKVRESSGGDVYTFNFIVTDLRCFNPKADTISLIVNVEDLQNTFEEFIPYNVFTPNDDQVNDYFELDNLPPDDCENQFLEIQIYNRWGKMVFNDRRRDFRWDGKGFSTGVYYYVLKYSKYDYKGTVSILY